MAEATNTTNPSVLRELADRCEREEPSRELEKDIAIAIGWLRVHWRTGLGNRQSLVGRRDGPFDKVRTIPAYTSSLDAAVTLVPEGAEYGLGTLYGVAQCEVGLNFSDDAPAFARREDGNVAMTLCAAALRARAALADGDA